MSSHVGFIGMRKAVLESVFCPAYSKPAIVGSQAATGLEIESPAMQRAHQLAVFDLAENAEVCLAVWAQPLDDVVPDSYFAGQVAAQRIELAPGFRLGSAHSLR
jgi:hypothetical protein